MEKEVKGNNKDIENIFMILKELLEKRSKPAPPKNRIGFKQYNKRTFQKKEVKENYRALLWF